MAWIDVVHEDQADGALREVYDDYRQASKTESVANILKVHSLSPASLKHHLDYYRQMAYGKGPLKRYQREMIASYVSKLNGCEY